MEKRKTIHKPWGKEVWLELNEAYCYKRIYINAGYKTSFQYHEKKRETNYIIEGQAEIWLENDKGEIIRTIMGPGDYFNVSPPKKHRVIAITDIILQEVSTPEVNDVIRINDEFNRGNGKINSEHKTPAVLILAAGKGTRLGKLTENINKALLPINNRAIISRIIEKFPADYDFVIALGYKGEAIKDYCKLAYPDHNFTFVEVDDIERGPGHSTFLCKEYLQRPFYLTVADCIIDGDIPHLDGNWLGVTETAYPEKYSTVHVGTGMMMGNKDRIIAFSNKDERGFGHAFIGLAGIWDYDVFWKQLDHSDEVVSAFRFPYEYPSFTAKELHWLDTGNLDDLNRTRDAFGDKPLSLYKETGEITYREGDRFIKYHPNYKTNLWKASRAHDLGSLIPKNFEHMGNFIAYDWTEGATLYEEGDQYVIQQFLEEFKHIIDSSSRSSLPFDKIFDFYTVKTAGRLNTFSQKYGIEYLEDEWTINGKKHQSLSELLSQLDFTQFQTNPHYDMFHGDLQFDNIVYGWRDDQKFTYIDWRSDFGGDVTGGDLYYDLAKMYGGCLINYWKMKRPNNVKFREDGLDATFGFREFSQRADIHQMYEDWLVKEGYDLNKVRLITGLIFLNMSPLHDELFGKALLFKGITLLEECI